MHFVARVFEVPAHMRCHAFRIGLVPMSFLPVIGLMDSFLEKVAHRSGRESAFAAVLFAGLLRSGDARRLCGEARRRCGDARLLCGDALLRGDEERRFGLGERITRLRLAGDRAGDDERVPEQCLVKSLYIFLPLLIGRPLNGLTDLLARNFLHTVDVYLVGGGLRLQSLRNLAAALP